MAEVTCSQLGGMVSVVWASGSRAAEAATKLLGVEIARLWKVPAEEVRLARSCPRCGSSDHGRPTVLPRDRSHPPFVSLSRAGDVVVVAVSERGPVGVDVERLDALRFAGFDNVALHQHEIAPTIEARAATWVRKESLLKATGDALHLDPRLIRLSDPDQPPALLEWSAPHPPTSGVWMHDVHIQGHAGCVTVLCDEPPELTLRRAVPEELPR